MNAFALMRELRAKSFVRSFTRGRSQQRLQYISLTVLGGIFSISVFGFSLLGIRALLRIEGGEELAARMLAGVYTFAAFALVFVGLASALYTMYLSRDVEILASMPIKERTIFAYKFWETLLGNSSLFIVLGLPAILAYGVAAGASLLFYPAVVVVSVLVLMIPTALCVLLIMPLMRVLPAGKAREIVGALGILAFSVFYVGQQFFIANQSRAGGSGFSPLRIASESPMLNVPPGSWASEALSGAAFLEWGRLLGGILPLAALSVVAYAVCMALTGWAYATGRTRAAESGGRVRTARATKWTEGLLGPLPQDIRAVAVKDLTVLPRDLRRLARAVFPALMLVGFIAVRSPGIGAYAASGGLAQLFPYLAVAGFAGLISLQNGLQAVGIEGRSYWFLAAAPLGAWRILVGKWVAASSVGAILALVGTVGVAFLSGFYLPGLLLSLAGGVVVAAVVSLYSVGISALFPRFDWENPNQTVRGGGGFAGMLCFFGLMASTALAVALAFAVSGFVPLWASAIGAALLWAACGAVGGYAVFSAGAERLRRLDWEL